MKNTKFLNYFLFLLLISCSTEEINYTNDDSNKVQLLKTTSLISPTLYNIGVAEIKVKQEKNALLYTINFDENAKFIEKEHPLKDKKFLLQDNYLSIENSKTKLLINEDKLKIESSEYSGYLDNIGDTKLSTQLDNELGILVLFYNEIISQDKNKINTVISKRSSKIGRCSVDGFQILYSANFTRQSATAGIENSFMTRSDGSYCQQLTGIETSCVMENHGCISTKTFCCD